MKKKKIAADEYIRSEWTDEENVTFRKINTEKNEHLYFLFVVQLAPNWKISTTNCLY